MNEWISHQREHYKKNKLSKERIDKLNELEWWFWDINLEKIWDDKFEKLVKFYNINKTLPNSKSKDTIESKLGKWVLKQRSNYKDKNISDERIEKLEKLEWWVWEIPREKNWNENLNKIIKYYNENNKLPTKNKEKQLSQWIRDQKKYYKKDKMSKERIEILEKLYWWIW
jgi:hypothetical protein